MQHRLYTFLASVQGTEKPHELHICEKSQDVKLTHAVLLSHVVHVFLLFMSLLHNVNLISHVHVSPVGLYFIFRHDFLT